MDERMKFIARILAGEKLAPLCREFGISRVTGHKIWNRYKEHGSLAVFDRGRAPHKHPNQTPFEIEQLIVRLRNDKPSWGAPKILAALSRKHPSLRFPAISTIHEILDRNGLINKKKRREKKWESTATYLSTPTEPNDLWCVDFKGQFKLGNKEYCYPLTISDFATRFVIGCEAQETTAEIPTLRAFEQVFREYGLPSGIRSDHGIPFACGNSTWGLTRLSVWWISLGIKLERIEPGNPQQNGRHERMHRTLKQEATFPPRKNFLQQQETFNNFVREYNFERPHAALGMKRPADLYQKSRRPYEGIPDIHYPEHNKKVLITNCGRVCIKDMKIHISKAFANQAVGLAEVEPGIWSVAFKEFELGFFDEQSRKFTPKEDPFRLRFDKECRANLPEKV